MRTQLLWRNSLDVGLCGKKNHFSGYVFCWGKLTYEMTGRCNRWLCIQRWNFGIGGVGTLSDLCLAELINIALGFRGIGKHYKAILPEENEQNNLQTNMTAKVSKTWTIDKRTRLCASKCLSQNLIFYPIRCGILWKKHHSRSHQKTLWGVPFPSPKTVQNQRFYIILLPNKNQVIVFEFLDDSSCRKIP